MASPAIFNGLRTALLTAKGLLLRSGAVIDHDGEYNAIPNGHFEINATGWSAYADAAATSPVDMTGGSPDITMTRTTSTPLVGDGSGLITKDAADRQGQGVSYAFTIPEAWKLKEISIKFFGSPSANYTGPGGAEYLRVFVYDVTNATLITPTITDIEDVSGAFVATFTAGNSTAYRIGLHIAGTGNSAWTYKFDSVVVSASMAPIVESQGQIIGTMTDDDAVEGRIGQALTSTPGGASVGGSGALQDYASLVFTKGDWDVYGTVLLSRNGATMNDGSAEIAITHNSGNNGANTVLGVNYLIDTVIASGFTYKLLNIGPIRVTSDGTDIHYAGETGSGTQTLYLKTSLATITAGSPEIFGQFIARRRR